MRHEGFAVNYHAKCSMLDDSEHELYPLSEVLKVSRLPNSAIH